MQFLRVFVLFCNIDRIFIEGMLFNSLYVGFENSIFGRNSGNFIFEINTIERSKSLSNDG